MAFTQLLTQAAAEDKQTTLRLGKLITLTTDWSLDETQLAGAPVAEPEEPERDDVQVSAEEMEDSSDE